MNERTVVLVRHGLVENPNGVMYGRLPGFGLSDGGREQITQLSERLKADNLLVSKIYSSPLERTEQTAQIIGRILKADVELCEEITEIDGSFLIGKNKLQLAMVFALHGFNVYGKYYTQRGVESSDFVMERMRNFMEDKLKNTVGNFVIVSHGDPLMILLWSYLHQGKKIPGAFNLAINSNYPKKGEAIGVRFDRSGNFLRFNKFR